MPGKLSSSLKEAVLMLTSELDGFGSGRVNERVVGEGGGVSDFEGICTRSPSWRVTARLSRLGSASRVRPPAALIPS